MAYDRGENDEFVKPTKINTKQNSLLADGDTVVFINFRSDRARQISDALLNDDFEGFHRNKIIRNLNYLTLTLYDQKQKKAKPLFFPIEVKNSLGEIMEKTGRTQLRIAETEKYPHVTFFFNGGDEKVFDGEDRILIPSPKVSTYDLKPEMSAFELTEKLIEAIESKKYDLIICNFANGDMVGHTGDLNAAIKAVEALDQCIGKIADAIKKVDGHMIVTADHGNAEQMMDNINNQTHTQHTTNLVPFLYMGRNASLKKEGKLSDIAPSILTIMNESIPNEMTGENLITFND
jgi:2,3-bisphosphoglycerate-independent phosphoglycerate mutase